jgi:hypothetical protein
MTSMGRRRGGVAPCPVAQGPSAHEKKSLSKQSIIAEYAYNSSVKYIPFTWGEGAMPSTVPSTVQARGRAKKLREGMGKVRE